MHQHDTYLAMYENKKGSIQDCLSLIESGDVICMCGDCNQAWELSAEFHTIFDRGVTGIRVIKDRMGDFDYFTKPGMREHCRTSSFFYSPPMTKGAALGNVSYRATDLCDYAKFVCETDPCNVFIAACTPMDENGNLQVGMSLMWEKECYATCSKVILEVNQQLPRIQGGLEINIRDVDRLYETSYPLFEVPDIVPTQVEENIGQYVASLVHDGDCIQLGIGGIPNAVAKFLVDKHDLGLHSEMFNNAMGELIQKGVINGSRKNINKGKHLGAFFGGTRPMYDYMSSNPDCEIRPASYICDPVVIMQNNNQVSVNTILEMDLTGQVCSESIGTRQYSSSGGAFCFAYGALHSKGGRGILAFPSRSKKGIPKIKPTLTVGAQVTIPRNYVDYIVTEYGIARMRGRTLEERCRDLIAISHPDDRDQMTFEAKKLGYLF